MSKHRNRRTPRIVAFGTAGALTVSVLLGTGSGAFGTATQCTVGSGARALVAGDADGDGTTDLAAVGNGRSWCP
ncbi:FG-GAP repeat domain-containing protein [Streptomyces sp. NPDC001076]